MVMMSLIEKSGCTSTNNLPARVGVLDMGAGPCATDLNSRCLFQRRLGVRKEARREGAPEGGEEGRGSGSRVPSQCWEVPPGLPQ